MSDVATKFTFVVDVRESSTFGATQGTEKGNCIQEIARFTVYILPEISLQWPQKHIYTGISYLDLSVRSILSFGDSSFIRRSF